MSSSGAPYRTPGLPLRIPRPPPAWRPQAHAAALAVAIAIPALLVRIVEAHLLQEHRLQPALTAIADAAPVLLAGSLLYLAWRLVRDAAWTVAHRSVLFRASYFVGSALVQAVLAAALSIAVVVSAPDWLFGPRLVTSAASPTDDRVAYLYGGGLFCGYTVYYGRPGALVIERVGSGSSGCDDVARARLLWRDGQAEVVDQHGAPLPSSPSFFIPWGGC